MKKQITDRKAGRASGISPALGAKAVRKTRTGAKAAADKQLSLRDIRALELIVAGNRSLLHATDEAQLISEICRAAIEVGGYKLACVGYAQDDEEQSVLPVAIAGSPLEYVLKTQISWGDRPHGHGVTGRAIREGRTNVNRNFAVTPDMEAWRVNVEKAGLRSSIAIPLSVDGAAFGALVIYSSAPDAFDKREVALLEEFASDLAFGVNVVRTRSSQADARDEIAEKAGAIAAIQEASPLGVIYTDSDDRVLSYNKRYLELWGVSNRAVVDQTNRQLQELLSSKVVDPDGFLARSDDIFRAGAKESAHDVITLKDGRLLERYVAPARVKGRERVGHACFVRDITLQRQVERNLRRINRILLTAGGVLLLICLLLVLRPFLSNANLFSASGEFPLKAVEGLRAPYSSIAMVETQTPVPMDDRGLYTAMTQGTGFMVSPCYALTAYHVVLGAGGKAPESSSRQPVWVSLGSSKSGFLYNRLPGKVVRWSDFLRDWKHDWALIEVQGCPGRDSRIGWLPLADGKTFNPYQGSASVAGFDGAFPLNQMMGQSDCYFGRKDGAMMIRHYCASRPGLSGAPIFITSPDLRVVGIAVREQNHTQEIIAANDPAFANLATYIPDVLSDSNVRRLIADDQTADHGSDPGAAVRTAGG